MCCTLYKYHVIGILPFPTGQASNAFIEIFDQSDTGQHSQFLRCLEDMKRQPEESIALGGGGGTIDRTKLYHDDDDTGAGLCQWCVIPLLRRLNLN